MSMKQELWGKTGSRKNISRKEGMRKEERGEAKTEGWHIREKGMEEDSGRTGPREAKL